MRLSRNIVIKRKTVECRHLRLNHDASHPDESTTLRPTTADVKRKPNDLPVRERENKSVPLIFFTIITVGIGNIHGPLLMRKVYKMNLSSLVLSHL